jgi:hypothetical protein
LKYMPGRPITGRLLSTPMRGLVVANQPGDEVFQLRFVGRGEERDRVLARAREGDQAEVDGRSVAPRIQGRAGQAVAPGPFLLIGIGLRIDDLHREASVAAGLVFTQQVQDALPVLLERHGQAIRAAGAVELEGHVAIQPREQAAGAIGERVEPLAREVGAQAELRGDHVGQHEDEEEHEEAGGSGQHAQEGLLHGSLTCSCGFPASRGWRRA